MTKCAPVSTTVAACFFLLTIIIIFQLGLVTDGVSQQVKIDLHHFDIYIDQVNISA